MNVDSDAYVIPPPPTPDVSIAGSDRRFPIRRVYCVGRNYAAHAREMGAARVATPDRSERPMFFSKPADAVCQLRHVPYPPATERLEHEVELVVALSSGGARIPPGRALDCVFGYGVGIDLTRRDLQREAKERRHPWDMAKGFDYSAPCSALRPAERIGHPDRGRIHLEVNGGIAQDADLSDQIWSVAEVIAALSGLVRLAPGDLIFTGTPAGVGPVEPGDVLVGSIEGVGSLEIGIGAEPG